MRRSVFLSFETRARQSQTDFETRSSYEHDDGGSYLKFSKSGVFQMMSLERQIISCGLFNNFRIRITNFPQFRIHQYKNKKDKNKIPSNEIILIYYYIFLSLLFLFMIN